MTRITDHKLTDIKTKLYIMLLKIQRIERTDTEDALVDALAKDRDVQLKLVKEMEE